MRELIIEKDTYTYEGKSYNNNSIMDLKAIVSKRVYIYILGENVLIKVINLKGMDVERCLCQYEKENLIDKDTLIHYDIDKKHKVIYVYSIKQGLKVLQLADTLNRFKVYPIQFKLSENLIKKYRYTTFGAILLYEKNFYYIEVKNKKLALASTLCIDEFDVLTFKHIIENNKIIVLDESIFITNEEYLKNNYENKKIICTTAKELN